MAVTFEREEASEWLDEHQDATPQVVLPAADEDYAYAGARLLSWFPVVNTRGATYEPGDFDDELIGTLIGKQVNLEHDKARVVGSIISAATNDEGIDIGIRIDREQAVLQGLDINEMRSGNYFSRCSVELTKDPDRSQFYAYDEGMNVRKRLPVRAGRRAGVRRTTARDPYKLQGLNVAERIKPKRFTGVGLVHNPADKTSELYQVVASDEEDDLSFIEVSADDFIQLGIARDELGAEALTPGKHHADPGYQPDGRPRYQLDTPETVRAAARFFGNPEYRAKYTAEQIKHIDAAIDAAKKRFGIGETSEAATEEAPSTMSKEQADALEESVTTLEAEIASLKAANATLTSEKETASIASGDAQTRIAELTAELAAKETELASANATIAQFTAEKDAADKEKASAALLDELNAIHPIQDDERESLKERASHACGDDGVIRELKLERREAAVVARESALPAAVVAEMEELDSAAAADEAARVAAEREAELAAEFEPGSDPRQALGDKVRPGGKYRGFDEKDLSLLA